MSSALALASVTAVVRELLRDAFVDHAVSSIVSGAQVTAVAPDRIELDGGTPGVNVYLYLTTPNQGWRNAGLPSRGGDGTRLANPPLALDLHYMLTAYGGEDLQADVLLGVAMQRLHEVPVLERDTIRTILADAAILSGRLADSELAEQVELVKFTPELLEGEQLSKLWSAFQTTYRPTAAYLASVVLVEAEEPVRRALPVLTRGPVDPLTGDERGVVVTPGLVPPYPTLSGVEPPASQPAAQLNDLVRLPGHHLDGSGHAVALTHTRFDDADHSLAPDSVAADALTVTIPDSDPRDWPAGLYTVRATLTRDAQVRTTNSLPLALAPTLDTAGITVARNGGRATIRVPVAPHVRAEQTASLVVGDREVPVEPFTGRRRRLRFVLADAVPGTYPIRLRVDGVESALIDRTASPPEFDPSQEVVIP